MNLNLRNYHSKEDQELLSHYYVDFNNELLGILLQRYTVLVFGVCMKYLKNEEDAKDAVQQVVEKVIKELPKYKVEYFKSWLYMVAKNHCLMQLRKKSIIPVEINDYNTSLSTESNDFEALLLKEKSLDNLSASLGQLNKEQQECIVMFYLQKKSYQQICALTGHTTMQVKSYIQNGKRNLKIILERIK